MTTKLPPLTEAPQHVQLAVDLIYLLESNDIAPETALEALEIVRKDLLSKLESQDSDS